MAGKMMFPDKIFGLSLPLLVLVCTAYALIVHYFWGIESRMSKISLFALFGLLFMVQEYGLIILVLVSVAFIIWRIVKMIEEG